jgi:hypothetical protein
MQTTDGHSVFLCYSATLEAEEADIEQLEQKLDKVCQ